MCQERRAKSARVLPKTLGCYLIMTAYLVNHQKKNKIFKKREIELNHAIKNNFSYEKLVKAAKKLREAKLNVYKSEFSKNTTLPAHRYEPNEKARELELLPVE